MREYFLDDLLAEHRRTFETSVVRPSDTVHRPDWFWAALLGSSICAGAGAAEVYAAFYWDGSIITGLLLAVMGLVGLRACWPWMWMR